MTKVNVAAALMSIGAGLEFFKTLRVSLFKSLRRGQLGQKKSSCSKVALLSEYLGPVVLCVVTVFKPLARIIIAHHTFFKI